MTSNAVSKALFHQMPRVVSTTATLTQGTYILGSCLEVFCVQENHVGYISFIFPKTVMQVTGTLPLQTTGGRISS